MSVFSFGSKWLTEVLLEWYQWIFIALTPVRCGPQNVGLCSHFSPYCNVQFCPRSYELGQVICAYAIATGQLKRVVSRLESLITN